MSANRSNNDGTNLIINYLPQTVDEDELSSMFSQCGMLESVKIIRDGKSQISRGFAFIKYVDKVAADKAMRQFTGYKMGSKTLRVSLSRPAGEETRETNLLIENLPANFGDKELYQHFTVYGKIITHRVCRGPDGQSKCKGYVRYNLKSEAEDAITALHGINLGGADELIVRFADPPVVRATQELINKKTSRSAGRPYPTHTMRPTGSRPPVEHFPVATSSVRGTARPGRGRAVPQCMVPTHWPTAPSVEPWQKVDIGGEVDFSYVPENHKSSYDPEKGWCVFVYNLPPTANNETLYQLFCKFGAINSVKPVVFQDNTCKGFGFVHMMNYDDAYRSIEVLDGTPYKGKTLQVRFKNAKK